MISTSIVDRLNALRTQGQLRPAYELLRQAAASGNADALFTLALWRVEGGLIRRDLPRARRLLGEAADAGHPDAALFHAYFLASGAGGPSDWPEALRSLRGLAATNAIAAAQIALLDKMKLSFGGTPADIGQGQLLSVAPHVSLFSKFLSADEADYVRHAATDYLQPSMIVDPRTGKLMQHPIRRSDDATFGVFNEDLVISAINRRIAAISGTSPDQGEPLIVLRYTRGGEYRAHSDALPGTDNQRIATVILYLNTDYQGGETRFVETGLTVRGQVGDALLFHNVTSDGRSDPQSRHAGLPIKNGVKWIATRWIRARTFTYPAPRPALG